MALNVNNRNVTDLTGLAVLRAGKHTRVPVAVSSSHVGCSTRAGHLSGYNGRRRVRHRSWLLHRQKAIISIRYSQLESAKRGKD